MLPGVVALLSGVLDQPYLAAAVVQTATLVAASLLLVYPVYAYAQNVAYTEGLVALAIGLLLVTVANLLSFVPAATVRRAVPGVSLHPLVWMSLLNLAAGISATVGVYFFAREFLPTGGETEHASPGEHSAGRAATGGFETAGEGGSGGADRDR